MVCRGTCGSTKACGMVWRPQRATPWWYGTTTMYTYVHMDETASSNGKPSLCFTVTLLLA